MNLYMYMYIYRDIDANSEIVDWGGRFKSRSFLYGKYEGGIKV